MRAINGNLVGSFSLGETFWGRAPPFLARSKRLSRYNVAAAVRVVTRRTCGLT